MSRLRIDHTERRWLVEEEKGGSWVHWSTIVKFQNATRLVFGETRRTGRRFRLIDQRTGAIVIPPDATEEEWGDLL